MHTEDAEVLESLIAETKRRKANLAAFVADAEATCDYAEFDSTGKKAGQTAGLNEIVALDLLLRDIVTKAETIKPVAEKLGEATDVAQSSDEQVSQKTKVLEDSKSSQALKGRSMTKAISSNRGLTRCRKKTSGNARVSNRAKYDKKVKKLSGRRMVADEVQGHGGYSGESHGIAIHVNRSRKIT